MQSEQAQGAQRRLLQTVIGVAGIGLSLFLACYTLGWVVGRSQSPDYTSKAAAESFLVGALVVEEVSPSEVRLGVTAGAGK